MRNVRVLLANEPTIYREVISATLKELRPNIEVFTAAPEDLDQEFLRLVPRLVVCSTLTALVERDASAWVELYPEGTTKAVVGGLEGRRCILVGIDFSDLLSILDDATRPHGLE
jgi:hypothetical protein